MTTNAKTTEEKLQILLGLKYIEDDLQENLEVLREQMYTFAHEHRLGQPGNTVMELIDTLSTHDIQRILEENNVSTEAGCTYTGYTQAMREIVCTVMDNSWEHQFN